MDDVHFAAAADRNVAAARDTGFYRTTRVDLCVARSGNRDFRVGRIQLCRIQRARASNRIFRRTGFARQFCIARSSNGHFQRFGGDFGNVCIARARNGNRGAFARKPGRFDVTRTGNRHRGQSRRGDGDGYGIAIGPFSLVAPDS